MINAATGLREAACARAVIRQGRWDGMGTMLANLSALNQTLLVQAEKEEASGNVKHEAAN